MRWDGYCECSSRGSALSCCHCCRLLSFLTRILLWALETSQLCYQLLPPVVWDQNSANVCPCACSKMRLIKEYKLSYTTGLLHAWHSWMQWGESVWTIGHWVVLVQVIYCSKGRWVLFSKNQRHSWEIPSYSHSRKPDLPVTHSSPFSTWLRILFFVSFPTKTTLSWQGYGFCWSRRWHCHRNCPTNCFPTLIFLCIVL